MQQIPNPPSTYYEVLSEIKAELEDKYRLHDIEEIYSSYEGRITHVWFVENSDEEIGISKVAFLKTWYDKHDKQWNCTWKVLGDIDESSL